ncbi:MAG: alpha/beta fold hydrolase [Deltaproteobacteria bacterium]|nr:alpha/beta fold hydrolase [Deltaproteobacteria bacterium]
MPFLHANRLRIAYDEFGQRTDPPLLLIMGLGAQMIFWRDDFCRGLAQRGLRVIRFDNRDVGASTHFDSAGMPNVMLIATAAATGQPAQAPYLLRDMADDTAGVLDALDIDRAHIVGTSMGGMIAQTLAIHHPARVRSLTSIMSHTGSPSLPPPRPEVLAVVLAPQPTTREEAIERGVLTYRTIGSPGFPFDEPEVRDVVTRAYERGYDPAGTARQLAAILASGSRVEALRRLDVPTLVVHGREDPLVAFSGGEETAATIPGAEFLPIAGMGHDMPRGIWPQLIERIAALAARA